MQANRLRYGRKIAHKPAHKNIVIGFRYIVKKCVLMGYPNDVFASEFCRPGANRFEIINDEIVAFNIEAFNIAVDLSQV